ncbi:hypothetical protein [uncultured Oscillibacter sp.]|uniref:hypothetical protein n=1 Tax=uncultured Oscillibacter sp. TaxID=876091 RepID=UPI0025F0E580|nr:hypothetical protein [uncultured Oscillibacter sp.]
MKQKRFFSFLAVVLAAVLFAANAFAAGSYQDKDLPLGSSSEVLMVGEIEPTVMSVTVPSYVPFHISRSVEGENKVISPRVTVTSHSGVSVNIDVAYTTVNLSGLKGTTWSDGQNVGENQIAIGFQPEILANQLPTTLSQTKWLQANAPQYLTLTSLNPYGSSTLYVVGTLGAAVPEDSSFTVTPIFVVSKA